MEPPGGDQRAGDGEEGWMWSRVYATQHLACAVRSDHMYSSSNMPEDVTQGLPMIWRQLKYSNIDQDE